MSLLKKQLFETSRMKTHLTLNMGDFDCDVCSPKGKSSFIVSYIILGCFNIWSSNPMMSAIRDKAIPPISMTRRNMLEMIHPFGHMILIPSGMVVSFRDMLKLNSFVNSREPFPWWLVGWFKQSSTDQRMVRVANTKQELTWAPELMTCWILNI